MVFCRRGRRLRGNTCSPRGPSQKHSVFDHLTRPVDPTEPQCSGGESPGNRSGVSGTPENAGLVSLHRCRGISTPASEYPHVPTRRIHVCRVGAAAAFLCRAGLRLAGAPGPVAGARRSVWAGGSPAATEAEDDAAEHPDAADRHHDSKYRWAELCAAAWAWTCWRVPPVWRAAHAHRVHRRPRRGFISGAIDGPAGPVDLGQDCRAHIFIYLCEAPATLTASPV